MDSVTEENVQHIMKEKDDAKHELETLMKTSIYKMWINELDTFVKQYDQFKKKRNEIQSAPIKISKKKTKK